MKGLNLRLEVPGGRHAGPEYILEMDHPDADKRKHSSHATPQQTTSKLRQESVNPMDPPLSGAGPPPILANREHTPDAESVLEAILKAPDPEVLVQSMAEEDLFWLLLEADPNRFLEMLSLASEDQWLYLLDLLIWNTEGLDMDALTAWFDVLLSSDGPRFATWLLRDHPSLLLLFLSRTSSVAIRQEDEVPDEDPATTFTLDGVFFVSCGRKRQREAVRRLLEQLAELDMERYQAVLLNMNHILHAEEEENLRRFRDARLSDKGFVPLDEAMSVYAYLRSEYLPSKRLSEATEDSEESSPTRTAYTPVLLGGGQSAFRQAVEGLPDTPVRDRIRIEFANVCSQIMSADSTIPQDAASLKRLYKKASGIIGIGIERIAGGDTDRYTELVVSKTLHDLFRLGFSTLLDLQKQAADRWMQSWARSQGCNPSFWDTSWARILEGLLLKRPMRYDPDFPAHSFTDFETLRQVQECRASLEALAAVDQFLACCSQAPLPPECVSDPFFTYKKCLYTIWARCSLELDPVLAPLSPVQVDHFMDRMAEAGGRPDLWAGEAALDAFSEHLQSGISDLSGEVLEALRIVYRELLSTAWEEFGGVSRSFMDPKYMDLFWIASDCEAAFD